jgi:hypothetical protein
MQLPRGTFREIQKNRKTGDVLRELQHDRFSGICCISCHDEVCTLVIRTGDCILAEYGTGKGDAALENILHSFGEDDVDAAISSFDEVQIRLSLEFNTAEQVQLAGHRASQTRSSFPGKHHTVLPEHRPEKVHLTRTGQKNPSDPQSAIRTACAGQGDYEGSPTLHAGSGEEDDLFDSMNIEEVTGKLKAECKTLVKKLDLEHLMERDSE